MLTDKQKQLVESNLKYVFSVVRGYVNSKPQYEFLFNDLVQAGNIGLIQAVQSDVYDSARPLGPFAKKTIIWYIQKEIDRNRKSLDCDPMQRVSSENEEYTLDFPDTSDFSPEDQVIIKDSIAKKTGIDNFKQLCNKTVNTHKILPKTVSKIKYMYSNGFTLSRIEKLTGVCHKTIKKIVGANTRPKRVFTPELINSLKQEQSKGNSLREMSKKFNINRGTLFTLLKRVA